MDFRTDRVVNPGRESCSPALAREPVSRVDLPAEISSGAFLPGMG